MGKNVLLSGWIVFYFSWSFNFEKIKDFDLFFMFSFMPHVEGLHQIISFIKIYHVNFCQIHFVELTNKNYSDISLVFIFPTQKTYYQYLIRSYHVDLHKNFRHALGKTGMSSSLTALNVSISWLLSFLGLKSLPFLGLFTSSRIK